MYDNIEKRGAIINDNQFLGPKYVTTDSYRQIQEQILKYQQKQDEEVKNAVKAVHDLCIAVKKLDPQDKSVILESGQQDALVFLLLSYRM